MHRDDHRNPTRKLLTLHPAIARTGAWPRCSCLDAQYSNQRWRGPNFHGETQDTGCDAWKQLLDIIERCASDGAEIFDPGAQLEWADWMKIVTLPTTICKLTRVKELRLYGSNLVRIPPEIGEMKRLEVFDIYTSYRLHWLPFEIIRCANLRGSRISTRALYGNYKYRPPFPRLPSRRSGSFSKDCSVCRKALATESTVQLWISLRIASDVVPLLVHACSRHCVDELPPAASGYVEQAHRGGLTSDLLT